MIQGGSATQAKSRQSRKIRMGMIGGSQEAFIGAVHRRGSQLDGEIELVCGAFSSSPAKSAETGNALYLNPSRVYGSYEEMILKEKELDCYFLIKRLKIIKLYTISLNSKKDNEFKFSREL